MDLKQWYRRRKDLSTTTVEKTTRKKKTTSNSNDNTNKWRSYLDKNSYRVYYYNIDTKVVQWDKPLELGGDSDDDYSADDTASTTSIVTVEEDSTISSKVKGDDNVTSSSKVDTNSATHSAEKMREHMISSLANLQQLIHNSTEKSCPIQHTTACTFSTDLDVIMHIRQIGYW